LAAVAAAAAAAAGGGGQQQKEDKEEEAPPSLKFCCRASMGDVMIRDAVSALKAACAKFLPK
jgi:hypothetical protein